MAFDATKPPTSGARTSADMRANFLALQQALDGGNLIADPTFLIWAAGDAAAPTHYAVGGTTPTVARAGLGLGDTNRLIGKYCVKLTGGAAAGNINQNLLPATMDTGWQSSSWSFGCWVKSSVASAARIGLDDGIAAVVYSSYHSGSGAWEWLTVTFAAAGSATLIRARLEVAAAQTGYFSGATVVLGPIVPLGFLPVPVIRSEITFRSFGAVTVGLQKALYGFQRPALVTGVELYALTAPTGAALIVDVKHHDGAAFQSMFTTRPQINATGQFGGTQPDATYRYRCFTMQTGGVITDGLMNYDVAQVGSTIAGADLMVTVRFLTFARPLENFLGYTDVR